MKLTSSSALLLTSALLFASCKPDPAPSLVLPATVTIACTSASMTPTLKCGDRVLCTRFSFDLLQPGDIVLFWSPSKHLFVCHRIKERRVAGNGELFFTTRGDANFENDTYTLTRDVYIGKLDMSTLVHPLPPAVR